MDSKRCSSNQARASSIQFLPFTSHQVSESRLKLPLYAARVFSATRLTCESQQAASSHPDSHKATIRIAIQRCLSLISATCLVPIVPCHPVLCGWPRCPALRAERNSSKETRPEWSTSMAWKPAEMWLWAMPDRQTRRPIARRGRFGAM